jgi:hypothetical protein
MMKKTRSEEPADFGEDTLLVYQSWAEEERAKFMRLFEAEKLIGEIGAALGRPPVDVLAFASRCASKMRRQSRGPALSEETAQENRQDRVAPGS